MKALFKEKDSESAIRVYEGMVSALKENSAQRDEFFAAIYNECFEPHNTAMRTTFSNEAIEARNIRIQKEIDLADTPIEWERLKEKYLRRENANSLEEKPMEF